MYYWWHSGWNTGYYEYTSVEWWMIHYSRSYYYRKIKVGSEIRFWEYTLELEQEYGFKLRRDKRNTHNLDKWNIDPDISCSNRKSWKKLNKCRKQWQKKKYQQYLN